MTTDNQAKREKLLAKIRALLAMTEANGCTEAEAMNAAEAADKLMQEYDLTYTDVEKEVSEDRYGARRKKFTRSAASTTQHEAVGWCAVPVARYFNCKTYLDRDRNVVFFGSLEETRLAMDMLAMLVLSLDTEAARYMKSPERNRNVNGRTIRASFATGFCTRVCNRINDMRRAREAADQAHRVTGRSLVVVKDQVVSTKYRDYCREQGLNLRTTSRSSSVRSASAYHAGQAAGGRVDLGGGKVGGGQLRIGR
jgi:hypothetical protein